MTTPTAPAAELRAGVAMLNAAHQVLNGQMTDTEFADTVTGLVTDLWPDQPTGAVWPVAYMGLRAASLFATATDTDVETVLGFLGAETASLPDA